jgi:hypothetical protein
VLRDTPVAMAMSFIVDGRVGRPDGRGRWPDRPGCPTPVSAG